jgi:tetratricopeptide (TPR) repeat protein
MKRLIPILAILVLIFGGGYSAFLFGKARFERNFEEGKQAYRSQRYAEAEKFFTKAVFLAPRSGWVRAWLGVSFQAQGKDNEAVTALTKAIALGYDNFVVRSTLGDIFLRQRDFPRADAEYYQALQFDPRSAEVRRKLAISLSRRDEKSQEALKFALEATKLNPASAEVWSTLAAVYSKLGEHEKGLAVADEAIRLNPLICAPYNNKADILIEMGRYDEALPLVNKAIEIGLSKPAGTCLSIAYITRAELFEAKNNIPEAVADYEQAINIEPKSEQHKFYQDMARRRLQFLIEKEI